MKKTAYLIGTLLIAGTLGLFAQTPQNQETNHHNGHRSFYWPQMPMSTAQNNAFRPDGKPGQGFAPQPKKTLKEMREEQVEFFNKRIGLTAAEAEQFWPIVDDIRAQRWEINRELHQLLRNQNDINFDKTNKRLIELKTRDAELERECYNRLRKVLSPEKLYRYYQTDDAYYPNMLRDFRGGWGR